MAYTRNECISLVSDMCMYDMLASGILCSLTMAQLLLESANCNSSLSVKANNLFGIKAGSSWKGPTIVLPTKEHVNGQWITVDAKWRAYPNWAASIADHSALLTGASRYAKVVGEYDYKKACLYIREAGYATDPNYTKLLTDLIEQNHLYIFDSIALLKKQGVMEFAGCLH